MIVIRVKKFDFDNELGETYFRTPILAIWQTKDKEKKNFILKAIF